VRLCFGTAGDCRKESSICLTGLLRCSINSFTRARRSSWPPDDTGGNPSDILFNNAGICAYGLAHELSEDAWDAMLNINLKGAWIVARRVIPHMIARRSGAIINNSSTAGLRGMARLSHYAASKCGLVGLTKSWAIELAPYNIRVVSLHPTGVNTPMNDGLAALEGATPQQIAERSAGNLLTVPWIEPEDVAAAVVYLASDRARFITGSQFVLDAGLLTR
jgi:NAD(P)-dependent dehydrogenase (short-subunit alcohol dehydrogenase family)